MKRVSRRKAAARKVIAQPSEGAGVPRIRCAYHPPPDFFLRTAAEEGDPQAQFTLGRLCYEGAPETTSGVSFTEAFEQDHAQAAMWLQKAADQGHAGAAGLLEVVRAQGKGVH